LLKGGANMRTVKEIAKEIADDVEKREDELKQFLRRDIFTGRKEPDDTTFLVARRWNSWYPSYFDIEGGGSYLILTAEAHPDDKSKPPKKPRVILVDPGYGFLTVVWSLGINTEDIDTVIITHFHPDHMNGIFEYMSLRLDTDRATSIYMNPTTFNALGRSSSGNIDMYELPPLSADTLAEYQKKNDDMYERIIVRSVQTHHREVSNTSHPIGLIFEIEQFKSPFFEKPIRRRNLGIIGDTDAYHTHLESYAKEFHKCDVLGLHIGTFAYKPEGMPGKHLYLMGARQLLNEIEVERRRSRILEDQLVLISEFGMEHATLDQLYKAVSERLEVGPCQAVLGYHLERKQATENNRTYLAEIAYAHWFYHWLVEPLAYENTSVLLIASGLGCMLCASEECEQLLPASLDSDVSDRKDMSEVIIERIAQNCAEAKDRLKQPTCWATRFLTDAMLTRINFYGEEKSIKSSVERQLEELRNALGELEEIAKRVLPNPHWCVADILPVDEIEFLKEQIRSKNPNVDLDRMRKYDDQEFHDVLLYSILTINCLIMAVGEVWQEIKDIISGRGDPMLKRIEDFFRMENDWCTVFVADIGCEVIVGDKILMKTFDGKTLEPSEVESEYNPVERGIRYISNAY